MLNPIHTTKFFLTSFIRLCVRHEFFLNKESLTSWSCLFLNKEHLFVGMVVNKNLTRNWNQHHEITPQSSHSCYCRQGKFVQPYKRVKFVNENLRGKCCSLYTRASNTTKEFVKENVVVCAALKCAWTAVKM